jgi:L-methionine (R)-S-oxide reductase
LPVLENPKTQLKAIRYDSVSAMKQVNYADLRNTLLSLTKGETNEIALMATFVCEVHHSDDRFDWTGFYRVTEPNLLKIGPYQGGHGCLVIPFSRGVCGAAARENKTQLVAEVETFEGHIACASSTRSELVIPVSNAKGRLLGVLDIDSDQLGAFSQNDADHMGALLDLVFAPVA